MQGPPVAIRDFDPRDQDSVRRLVLEGLRERWGETFEDGRNPDLDDIADTYVHAGAEVVVAERGGQIVGTGTLLPVGEGCARIVRMSVDRRCRREGVARRVVMELVDRARARGMREVLVSTDTPWTSAVDLYRSCGFVEVGRDETDTHLRMQLAT